ncbi:PucR family transcriptional regulator [Actinomadura atramentaria]|uniref:PucR family transcriptional regulator n=1 Tax=Actinomadura atramentaria TaxID=1990 RepID=UPI0009FCC08E|nr:helix-turn-helix domain-containing protein [Actinomadura atramentaria]
MLAEIPAYSALPREEIAGDIAGIVQHCVRLTADVLERRGAAAPGAFARLRESAAQRADEGVPLEAIVSAYQLGTAMCWELLSADAGPGDVPALQELLGHVFEVQRQMVVAVTGAYMEARTLLDGQDREGRHAALVALLNGEPADRARPGEAELYVVLTLLFAPHPDETADHGPTDHGPTDHGSAGRASTRAGIAARRKIRRARAVLDRFGTGPALAELDGAGGTALLPVAAPPDWDDLRGLVARTAESAGVPVTAAASVAEPAAIPDAVVQNGEIADLVGRTGRPPGLYRLGDVLLEYQLSRPSAALPGLAGVLLPLERKPELLRTLETYLRHGLDRRATAAALHVHPNTVDYRVRRIDELTGLSPARHADVTHLSAALVARALVRPGPRHPAPGPRRRAGR